MSDFETVDRKENIDRLREVVDIQCSTGNWDCGPYMYGMANGLILALAIMENKEPKYLEAPSTWLCDTPHDPELATEDYNKSTKPHRG